MTGYLKPYVQNIKARAYAQWIECGMGPCRRMNDEARRQQQLGRLLVNALLTRWDARC